MFESTRKHIDRGDINWRQMKRVHKNNIRSNGELNIKTSKKIFKQIAKESQNENLNGWQYVRNIANWL